MVNGSCRHLSANALDMACTYLNKAMGFASVITVDNEATLKVKRHHNQGKLSSSREAHLKVMVVAWMLPIPSCPFPNVETPCSLWQLL